MIRLFAAGLVAAVICLPVIAATVPRPAPAYSFRTSDGRQIDLAKYKGKVICVQFLLTTCPHCQSASVMLEKLQQELGPQGLQVVGVAINDMAMLYVDEYSKKFHLTHPVGVDSRETAQSFLEHPPHLMMMMPQLVIVDRSGTIRAQYAGDHPIWSQGAEAKLRSELTQLLREPAKPEAKKTSR